MLGNLGAAMQGFGEAKMWRDKMKQRERELDIMESYSAGERQRKIEDHDAARSQRMDELQGSYSMGEQLSGQQGAAPAPPRARSLDVTPTNEGGQSATPPSANPGPPPPGVSNAEWLRYNNSGATRSKPISDDLQKRLGYIGDMGLTMEVFSGGQDGIETGSKRRVGSVRHDHGNAADAFFYKDGRRLDWGNEADRPIFEEIVRRGVAVGVTGWGAGPGYMQQGSMHIGMGNPGVWGAGGNGANAPSWLRAAYGNPWVEPQRPAAAVAAASAAPATAPTQKPAAVAAPKAASEVIARGIEAGQSLADQILARIKG